MDNALSTLLTAIKEAGAAVLNLQQTGFHTSKKTNGDIVTQADLLANEILASHIRRSFPEDGWLSEETADDLSRLQCKRVWIVDPIDGTREYAANIPEYALSVALVEEGKPVLAAIYHPPSGELFYAVRGQGAWLGNRQIHCDPLVPQKLLLLASRSEFERGEWERFLADHQVKPVGSIAYKLALVAAGRANATFSLGPKNEWDIAAGVLLVHEAGGVAINKAGKEVQFNCKNTLVDGMLASSKQASKLVQKIAGRPW